MRQFKILLPILTLLATGFCFRASAASQDSIRLNQLGFLPYGPKVAVVVSPETWYFSIRSLNLVTTYFSGELSAEQLWDQSGERVKVADFSMFTKPGTYVVYVAGVGASYPFTIGDGAYAALTIGLIKSFYYQRASTALLPKFAGQWSRSAGHADMRVIVHPSAETDSGVPGGRRAGDIFASPKGWYDAGDYGKYVVNAGVTLYSLLLLYDQFSAYFDTLNLKIPESDDALPDLLNEIRWELDWLLTMQDPHDGGVYHKLTGKTFIGDLMPVDADEERFFIGKGAAATFDFAAVCAMASRVYKKFQPTFADSCRAAAELAWKWGSAHPNKTFKNPPDVVTGEYGDSRLTDEHQWAAFELYLATGDTLYYTEAKAISVSYPVPSWPNVGLLGCYSLALAKNDAFAVEKVLNTADALQLRVATYPYRTTMYNEFYWGSNGVAANQGMTLLVAYLISKKSIYLEGAMHALDYFLGRNAVGYSFVTGFGKRSAMNPHHRPSVADKITAPVPGFLVGGPNQGNRSGEVCTDTYSTFSAKAWLDQSCSFTTNEVAINWNAPAAFLAGGIAAAFSTTAFDLTELVKKYAPNTTPPEKLQITVVAAGSDHIKLNLVSKEPVVATLFYDTVPKGTTMRFVNCPVASSATVKLDGLVPEHTYYLSVHSADRQGNVFTQHDTVRTETSLLAEPQLYSPEAAPWIIGEPWRLRVKNRAGILTRLLFSRGGSAVIDTFLCNDDGGTYTAEVPGTLVGAVGATWSLLLTTDSDTLQTSRWSSAPDSVALRADSFTVPNTYRLISLPLLYTPEPSCALSASLGDTALWRYYGFSPEKRAYQLFDTLQPGRGGWLIHKNTAALTHHGAGLKPDTLVSVVLRKGWNCIGNPYLFPLYWDNLLVSCNGALIPITDSAAAHFVRRQYVTYHDTTADNKSNGYYASNRALTSALYNDTAAMRLWEGCWAFAEVDSVTCFFNPAPQRPMTTLTKKRETQSNSWFYTLIAASDELTGSATAFGAAQGASCGYDGYDAPCPPVIARGLEVGFSHPEWQRHSGLYAADVISLDNTDAYTWNLQVHTQGRRPVTLSWQREGVRSGRPLYLVDLQRGAVSPLQSVAAYTFTPNIENETSTFAITTTPEKRELAGTGQSWGLTSECWGANGNGVKLTFNIPSSATLLQEVSLEVFDIRGRLVTRLVRGAYPAGVHAVTWNRNAAQERASVARGMYIVRLTGNSYAKSVRISLVR